MILRGSGRGKEGKILFFIWIKAPYVNRHTICGVLNFMYGVIWKILPKRASEVKAKEGNNREKAERLCEG